MGTFHLQASIVTRDVQSAAAFLETQTLNSPVLRFGDTALLLLPCGSKQGWLDDRHHQQLLHLLEAQGGRTVTTFSEIEDVTLDHLDAGSSHPATWLSFSFEDPDELGTPSDPASEAVVKLPINCWGVRLTLSATPPEFPVACVLRLPPGLSFTGAAWSGLQGER
ncbi:hypothetical protein DVJ83_18040 (plasmid) [Deinococcus wulumuqiensis]|uniref:Uncharacterized protein n=1 Tax=Deinococcus wulumuqiensis TaxID=980427 RepID=A0A345IMS6_9DEIO|nr:hypothetical protein [Deinococcus wulumuqiensis]AXH00999.1 hypothetical protein DVJ83_18040 [Deinococcus wulumuqiensis]